MDKTVDIACLCHQHLLRVSWEPGGSTVDLAAWAWRGSRTGWWQRLRMIGRIIRVGHPYADDLTLTVEEASSLVVAFAAFDRDRLAAVERPTP